MGDSTKAGWKLLATVLALTAVLVPLPHLSAQGTLTWYDPLEEPQLPQLDVKAMHVSWNGNITLTFEFYGTPSAENFTVIGNVYLDRLVEGEGVPKGDVKGADYRLVFSINPNQTACSVQRFNSLKNGWDLLAAACWVKMDGGKVIVTTPNVTSAFPKGKFGVKAYMWMVERDDFDWVTYRLKKEGAAKIDGKLGDYGAPTILDPIGDADRVADYRELYAKDDFYRLYFAIVPVDGLGCNLRGYGARLERFFNIYVDADLNRSNGHELWEGYLYRCNLTGRTWERLPTKALYVANPALRRQGVMVGEVFESYVYLGPVRKQIVDHDRQFGLRASVVTRLMDAVPDKGWLIYRKDHLSPDLFEVTGPDVDMSMNEDLSGRFKSFRSASGLYRITLGGPAVNPSYSEPVKFVKKGNGLYYGIEIDNTTYWASYGRRDFAVIGIHKAGEGVYITAAGVTRFGTRAALVWLSENMPLLNEGVYILSWMDDGDGKVEISEIGVVAIEGS